MLDIAAQYVERHGGERIAAALEFVRAIAGVAGVAGYSADLAILATIDAFDLSPLETIHLVAAYLGKEM